MHTKLISLLAVVMLLLNACVPVSYPQSNGSEEVEEERASIENVPEEASRDELMRSLERNSEDDVAAMIGNSLYLLDVINGEAEEAYIYATRRFEAAELASIVADLKEPVEMSDFQEDRQILIYDSHFVTFKQAEEDPDSTIIEVASDQFVENNYSPNYFGGFFTFLLLNRMLGTNNWQNRRMEQCRNTRCYGGYSNSRSYNPNGSSTQRGISGYRGGGPGTGK